MAKGVISHRPDIKFIFGWAIVFLLYAAIRINLVDIPLNRDEGAFGYFGQIISNHGMPYKDAMDHKPPVVFYLYSIALLFVSATSGGIHLFLYVYNFITLVALYFLVKTCFRSSTAGLWSAFVYAIFSASPTIHGFMASTEMFMLLPITMSLLFAVLAVRGNNAVFSVLSGFSGGLACWTKQVAAFSVAFALLYLAAHQLLLVRGKIESGAESKAGRNLVLWWCGGAAGISLLIAGYFFSKGVFNDFVYWNFTHNIYYSARITSAEKARMLLKWLMTLLREDFIIISIGLLYSIFAAIKKDARGYFTLGFLVFSFMGTLPGFAYEHYFAQIAPAISIAAGFSFSEIIRLVPSRRKMTAILVCATLAAGVPIVVNHGFYLEKSPEKISRNIFGNDPFPESMEIAGYISGHSTPRDRVFILGSEPQILFYAQRRSASRFVMVYPLTFAHPGYKEMQESAWQDIAVTQPRFILVVNRPTSIFWDRKAEWIPFVQKIMALVEKDYQLVVKATIDGEDIIFLYQKSVPQS